MMISSESYNPAVQQFSQKSRTPTVAKYFQIGLYDTAEADLEHFWNCCSDRFLGERLYALNIAYAVRVLIPPFSTTNNPGTCVQYPGFQGGGALSDASTPDTPADSIAASAHGGTYSHAAVAGRMWGGERAAATAAAAARWRRATSTGGAITPPRSAPAHGG